jgi:hypothetical protein
MPASEITIPTLKTSDHGDRRRGQALAGSNSRRRLFRRRAGVGLTPTSSAKRASVDLDQTSLDLARHVEQTLALELLQRTGPHSDLVDLLLDASRRRTYVRELR